MHENGLIEMVWHLPVELEKRFFLFHFNGFDVIAPLVQLFSSFYMENSWLFNKYYANA